MNKQAITTRPFREDCDNAAYATATCVSTKRAETFTLSSGERAGVRASISLTYGRKLSDDI